MQPPHSFMQPPHPLGFAKPEISCYNIGYVSAPCVDFGAASDPSGTGKQRSANKIYTQSYEEQGQQTYELTAKYRRRSILKNCEGYEKRYASLLRRTIEIDIRAYGKRQEKRYIKELQRIGKEI